jgi:replication factor C subunit 2/4
MTTIPWIEKYRPKTLDELMIDDTTRSKITNILNEREMPNIIITGVPGIGKTTTILCMAKLLLGPYYSQAVLELNAADDRGIKSVQESITNFCKKKMVMEDSEEKLAKHKIIILDEGENLTGKAQQLISNIMEKYSKTTRFAFTCNNSMDIIESIQSRCIILRYPRVNKELLKKRLIYVCDLEKVKYDEAGLDSIIKISNGDMRTALNILESTSTGYHHISVDTVYKLNNKPQPIIIMNIFKACTKKELLKACGYIKQLIENGDSPSDIILSMVNVLKDDDIGKVIALTEDEKMRYMTEISKTCIVINKGIATNLQLDACMARLCYSEVAVAG